MPHAPSPGPAISLVLLGLGWNAALVSGSVMVIAAAAPPNLRAHMEGAGEIAMALAAALGATCVGLLVHLGGFDLLSVTAAAVGTMPSGSIVGRVGRWPAHATT